MYNDFSYRGVTTNPSILKKEGKLDYFQHLKALRRLIGHQASLHVQVVSNEAEGMVAEAHKILDRLDRSVYIKVPVTLEGLKAIKELKSLGIGVTATAIYSAMQAFLAIESGADFVAPYYNRMENLGLDVPDTLRAILAFIQTRSAATQLLGASYKNVAQVTQTLVLGAHCVTVAPELLSAAVSSAPIQQVTLDFQADWESVYGPGATLLD